MSIRVSVLALALGGCGLIQGRAGWSSSSSSGPAASKPETEAAPVAAPANVEEAATNEGESQDDAQAKKRAAWEAKHGGKRVSDFEKNGDSKYGPLRRTWSPLHQYHAISDHAALVTADELGERLSQAGRVAVIQSCFANAKPNASAVSRWAVCGADVEAFDPVALDKELRKEGLSQVEREAFITSAKDVVGGAKAIGAAVTELAKGDPGLGEIVAMGKTARTEWSAFASAHADQLAKLAELQDLVREHKNGLAGDCLEQTRPAMEKIVRATKWRERDQPTEAADFFVNMLPPTTAAFIATEAWAACASLTHPAGDAIYAAATAGSYGWSTYRWNRYHRRGPRTLTVAKLYQEPFEPKFASRDLTMNESYGKIDNPHKGGAPEVEGYGANRDGKIAKLTKGAVETTVVFSDERVIRCDDWQDTNQIESVTAGGDVVYVKKCMHRSPTTTQEEDALVPNVYAAGLAPGVELTAQRGFPIVVRRGNKVIAALGIKL